MPSNRADGDNNPPMASVSAAGARGVAVGDTYSSVTHFHRQAQPADFFISYVEPDQSWAEWIAWQLEGAGYKVMLDAWDIIPGDNFILRMHNTLDSADRYIAVLTDRYLRSAYAVDEWTAALFRDRTGTPKLIPVVVEHVESIPPLLSAIVRIDLTGLNEEDAAERLIESLQPRRARPLRPPTFPASVPDKAAVAVEPSPSSLRKLRKEKKSVFISYSHKDRKH